MFIGIGMALQRRGGGPSGPTYAAFQAHIATLAVNGTRLWSDTVDSVSTRRRVVVGAPAGAMEGTTWIGHCNDPSSLSRAIQHGLPSLAALTALNGLEVYYELVANGSALAMPGLDRNSYLSPAAANTNFPVRMVDLIYWDGAAARRMNPFAGTGPTLYTF